MRRTMGIVVAVFMLLLAAGCSSGVPASTTAPGSGQVSATAGSAASTGAALGSYAPGAGYGDRAPGQNPTAAANQLPKGAFNGVPGAGEIALAADNQPHVSRSHAVELSNAAMGAAVQGASLVSVVYVTLPTTFVRSIFSDPAKIRPTNAWLVTYTGVSNQGASPGATAGTSGSGTYTVGSTTVVLDATSGEQLLRSNYPTPR